MNGPMGRSVLHRCGSFLKGIIGRGDERGTVPLTVEEYRRCGKGEGLLGPEGVPTLIPLTRGGHNPTAVPM